MAKKRGGVSGSGKKMARSGLGRGLISGIWLIIVIGGVVGWAKANDIRSFHDARAYVQSWSDKTDKCIAGDEKRGVKFVCGHNAPDPKSTTPAEPAGPSLDSAAVKTLNTKLKSLPVKSSKKVTYDRKEWRHWSDLDKNGCNSREDVLIEQGTSIKTEAGKPCKVISGVWVSPYENKKITVPRQIDIDHVIPLGYAATHGGQTWSLKKKENFANDFSQLLATSAHENRSKGSKGPGKYMPPRVSYHCNYANIWIKTTTKYKLWIDTTDEKALEKALATC